MQTLKGYSLALFGESQYFASDEANNYADDARQHDLIQYNIVEPALQPGHSMRDEAQE